MHRPLIWALLGVVPLVLAMIALRQQYRLLTILVFTGRWWYTKTTLNVYDVEQSDRVLHLAQTLYEATEKWFSELLFSFAAFSALLQLVYGAAILSTLVPVSFFDALPIVARYAFSNALCRLVLLVELDGI